MRGTTPRRLLQALALLCIVVCAGALAACNGGGGGGPTEKSPLPDGTKIVALNDFLSGDLAINGAAGAVEPFALVQVRDPNGLALTANANAAGGFLIDAVPLAFVKDVGTPLEVTQIAPGKSESDAAMVSIVSSIS